MSTRFDAKITLTSWFFFVHLLVLASLVSFPVRADLLNRLIRLVTKGNLRIAFPFAMDNTVLVSDCINLFHMWYVRPFCTIMQVLKRDVLKHDGKCYNTFFRHRS